MAGFIGISSFLDCQVEGDNPSAMLKIGDYRLSGVRLSRPFTGQGKIAARPEYLSLAQEGIGGRIELSTFLGDFIEYEILLENGQTLQLNEYTKRRPDHQARRHGRAGGHGQGRHHPV